jgi:hypothetical protein
VLRVIPPAMLDHAMSGVNGRVPAGAPETGGARVMTTTRSAPAATPELVEAARLMLSQMGLRPEDLLTGAPMASTPSAGPVMPTFGEYIAVLVQARPPGFQVYRNYWKRINATWGDRRLDEVTPSDIDRFITEMKDADVVRTRKNFRGGRSAGMHAVSAFRSLYRHAEADGLISEANPRGFPHPTPASGYEPDLRDLYASTFAPQRL